MKGAGKIMAVVGILLVLYAIASRFIGEPGTAAGLVKSSTVLSFANTALLIGILLKLEGK